MLMALLKWDLKNSSHGIMRTLLRFFSHPQLTLVHYNNNHGHHLACHPVPHQDCINYKDLDNRLPDPTDGCGTDGWAHMYKIGILLPMPQSLP